MRGPSCILMGCSDSQASPVYFIRSVTVCLCPRGLLRQNITELRRDMYMAAGVPRARKPAVSDKLNGERRGSRLRLRTFRMALRVATGITVVDAMTVKKPTVSKKLNGERRGSGLRLRTFRMARRTATGITVVDAMTVEKPRVSKKLNGERRRSRLRLRTFRMARRVATAITVVDAMTVKNPRVSKKLNGERRRSERATRCMACLATLIPWKMSRDTYRWATSSASGSSGVSGSVPLEGF